MAKKNLWLGMLVMVLVFGVAVVGCDPDSKNGSTEGAINPFVGTWVFGNYNLVFNADLTGTYYGTFTYTYSGNTAHLSFPFVTYGSNDATIISENALSFAGYIWVKR
jgi:hypothetical protein